MEKMDNKCKNTGLFAAGVLFGTAGIKLLSSKDAKKLYTKVTAAVLRAKSSVMKTATTIQETPKIFSKTLNRSTTNWNKNRSLKTALPRQMQKMRSKPLKRSENRPKKKANRR